MKKVFLISSIAVGLASCAYMARSVIAPNSCKKCEVIDNNTGSVVWTEDECGGGVANMEQRAKVEAYDRGCHHTVKCESYKRETPE